ncbi:MAG: hypothetical protein ACI86H_002159, partial [bacterium]
MNKYDYSYPTGCIDVLILVCFWFIFIFYFRREAMNMLYKEEKLFQE